MRGVRRAWLDLVRELGETLIGLARAAVKALVADLAASGRRLRAAAILFAAAASCGLLALAAAGVALFESLALVLPRWGAALILCGTSILAAAVLGWVGRRRLRQVEGPRQLLDRHRRDHLAWWQRTLGREGGRSGQGDSADAQD